MRYWYDSEFIDTGSIIDLISVGIVAEDGRELSLQSTEFNIDRASPWVRENVIMHLDPCPHILTNPPYSLGTLYGAQAQHMQGRCADLKCPWRTRAQLREEVGRFLTFPSRFAEGNRYGEPPELHGWCCSYDHVALCQLIGGTMMGMPQGWPHYMKDLQFVLDEKGITDDMLPKQEGDTHHALADAKYIKKLWETVL